MAPVSNDGLWSPSSAVHVCLPGKRSQAFWKSLDTGVMPSESLGLDAAHASVG